MRIVFVTDLHGNKDLYLQLKNYINEKNADILIIGGDLFEYSPTYNLQVEFIHEFLYDFFIKLDVLTYIIPGNCDRIKAIELLNEFKNDGKLKILNLDGINLMDAI